MAFPVLHHPELLPSDGNDVVVKVAGKEYRVRTTLESLAARPTSA